MNIKSIVVPIAAALIAAGLAMTAIAQSANSEPASMNRSSVRVVPQDDAQIQLSFAPVVRSVAPAVVNVYATRIEQRAVSPFASDPFFGRFFGNGAPFLQNRPRQSQSLGSGVIVDPSGVILTNSHVVSSAIDTRVTLSDRREFAVDIVLDDPETDLAVLRVQAAPGVEFPAVEFADSDALQVGDLVLAIGNPFGVGQSVTSGIVSALARTGVEATDYEFFIQTDAAINPGNSGGALVDLSGRLVGINTAIYTRGGGSIGIGFAIPSNMARLVADAGRSGSEIIRPWLGAKLQAVDAVIASGLRLAAPSGALVTEVAPDGPAERAGLRSGDVVVAFDGVGIEDPSALTFRLASRPPRETVELGIARQGQLQAVMLPLEPPPTAREDQIAQITGNTRFAGVRVQELDPALAEKLGLPYDARGMAITSVVAGSPAHEMGLAVGDVILALNGVEMDDAAMFSQIAGQRPRTWEIVLQRNGQVIRTYVSG